MPTLADLRTQIPALDGLDDENAIAFVQERYYPTKTLPEIAAALGYKAPPAPTPPASIMDRVSDTGVGLMQGGVGAVQGVVGLADLVSGGAAGKGLEDAGVDLQGANQYWADKLSPTQQAVNAKVAGAFAPQPGDNGADPYLRGGWAAIKNPSSIYQSILQSLPSMAVGGVIGRGATALAPRLGGWASGIGEGTITAGHQAEQIRTDQLNPGHTLTDEQSLLAGGSGAATGLIAGAVGRLAQRLGFETAHNLMAGIHADPVSTLTKARQFLGGALSEGTQEFLQSAQEQMAQNVAVGADPWKDVPQNAVMGALAGVGMGVGANLMPTSRRLGANNPDDELDPNTPPEVRAAARQAMADIGRAGSADAAIDAFRRTQLPVATGGIGIDGDAAMRRLAGATQGLAGATQSSRQGPADGLAAPAPTMDPETGELVPAPPFGERLEALRAQLEDSRVRQHIRESQGNEALNDILHFAAAADNPNLPGVTSDRMLARAEQILAQAQATPVPGSPQGQASPLSPLSPAAGATSPQINPQAPLPQSISDGQSVSSQRSPSEIGTSPVSTPIAPTVPRQGAFDSEAAVRQHLSEILDPQADVPTVPKQFPDGSWGYTTDKTAVEAYKNRSLKERAASMAMGEPQPAPAPRGAEQLPEPMEGKNGMKAVFTHSKSKPGQIHVTLFDEDSDNAVGTKIVGSIARAKFEAEKLLGIRKPEEKFFEPRANLARAGVELAPAPAPAPATPTERRKTTGSIFDRLKAEGDAQKKRLGDADLERAEASAPAEAPTPAPAAPPPPAKRGDFVAIKFPDKTSPEHPNGYTKSGVLISVEADGQFRVKPNGGKVIVVGPDRIEVNGGQPDSKKGKAFVAQVLAEVKAADAKAAKDAEDAARRDYWNGASENSRRSIAQNAGLRDNEQEDVKTQRWERLSSLRQKKLAVVIDAYLKVAPVVTKGDRAAWPTPEQSQQYAEEDAAAAETEDEEEEEDTAASPPAVEETPEQVAARIKRFGSYAHDDAIDDKLRARVLEALRSRPDAYRVHGNGPDDTRIHLGIEPLRSYGNDGQIILKDNGTALLAGDDDAGWSSTMSKASVKRTLGKWLKKVDETADEADKGEADATAETADQEATVDLRAGPSEAEAQAQAAADTGGDQDAEVAASGLKAVSITDQLELRTRGESVASVMDAERRFSNGERLFVMHEMGEEPAEAPGISDIHGYTADQIMALPKPTPAREGPIGDVAPEAPATTPASEAATQQWYEKDLTAEGRRRALQAVGGKVGEAVRWHYLKPDLVGKLVALRESGFDPDAERDLAEQRMAAPAHLSVLAMDEKAIASLAGRSIEIPVQVGDSGKTATMKMDAAEAVRDIQKRAKAADEMRRCLE